MCFRLRSVCFKLFCVLSFDVLWEVFGLHIFTLFCVLSFDVLLEVFGLHCFVCCPLESVWFTLSCVLSFGKCLVYIVLCVVLLKVFGLHCFVCCPLGSVWFTVSCVLSFWTCSVYIVLCVVLWEVLGSLGMSLPRKTGGIPWGCTKSGPSPFTVQPPPEITQLIRGPDSVHP